MHRLRLTQAFPALLPLRKAQRRLIFYARMRLDANAYARTKASAPLPYLVYEAKSTLLNPDTGFDMRYQENKVFNLKLAAETINRVLIRPGETFSFWQLVRYAERMGRYRQGLCVANGRMITVAGGGMCQLSSLLFWLFLHTPLTVLERHNHGAKDFPVPEGDTPDGVDATVSEGWLDLKVKNETEDAFQIELSFSDVSMHGRILADCDTVERYKVVARDLAFFREGGRVYQRVSIYRQTVRPETREVLSERKLYTDLCEIGYALPAGTQITESGGRIDG